MDENWIIALVIAGFSAVVAAVGLRGASGPRSLLGGVGLVMIVVPLAVGGWQKLHAKPEVPLVVTGIAVGMPIEGGQRTIFAHISYVNRTANTLTSQTYWASWLSSTITSDAALVRMLSISKQAVSAEADSGEAPLRSVGPFEQAYTSTDSDVGRPMVLSASDYKLFQTGKMAYYFLGLIVISTNGKEGFRVPFCGYGLYDDKRVIVEDCPPFE